MVTVPLPSSSAPGAGSTLGRKRFMLSWCAPTITVLLVLPGMVAIMECWPQECSKARTEAEEEAEELRIVEFTCESSQREESAP